MKLCLSDVLIVVAQMSTGRFGTKGRDGIVIIVVKSGRIE